MAGLKRGGKGGKGGAKLPATPPAEASADTKPTGPGGVPLPSPVAGTNLVIADIVLRAAGDLLRNQLERGLLVKSYDRSKAEKLVDGRGVVSSLALWGASSLARRSPIGLALVAGGLAAKVFYDRGKKLERKSRAKPQLPPKS